MPSHPRGARLTPPAPAAPLALRSTTRSYTGCGHELGQNFLVDRRVIAAIVDAVSTTPALPVLELGAGDGAVTAALASAGHTVTAVEMDQHRIATLRRRWPPVTVVQADMLTVRADSDHQVVSNVPFGITTPLLRHLLGQDRWHTAVLLLQWEVARKRAGVGGTTLLTAQWWPWVEFTLRRRVDARAFRPVPSVDGGLLSLHRRPSPLVPAAERGTYQLLVRRVFDTGSVATSVQRLLSRDAARSWLDRHGLDRRTLARDLDAEHWAALHALHRRAQPARPRRQPRPRPR